MRKLLLLFVSLSLVASFSQGLKNIADKEYKNMRYSNAVEYYTKYLKSNPTDTDAKKLLADSFYKLKDNKNAARIYSELYIQNPNDSSIAYHYASALLQEGNVEESKKVFENLKDNKSYNIVAVRYCQSIDQIDKLYKDSNNVKLYDLNINTSNAEFSPVYYKDKLVFAGARNRNYGNVKVYGWNHTPYLHIYQFDTTKIQKSILKNSIKSSFDQLAIASDKHSDETVIVPNDSKTLGYYGTKFNNNTSNQIGADTVRVSLFSSKINTKYHDGPCVFTKDGKTMFFTRNSYSGGKRGKDKTKVTRLKIYTSTFNDTSWSKPIPLPFCSEEYSVGHPALSSDEKTLYFVSDMPGGYGSTDIYKVSWSEKGKFGYNNRQFGKPENLGKEINSPAKEMFPTLDKSGVLFFSSKGHGGLGGLDVFAVDLKNKSQIRNVGYPINSQNDDFGIIFSTPTNGYLSSNRKNGGFDDDILAFDLKKPIKFGKTIKVIAIDELDNTVIPSANLSLLVENKLSKSLTDAQGANTVTAEANVKHFYTLTKTDYFPANKEVVLEESFIGDTLVVKVPMMKNVTPTLQCLVTDKQTGEPLEGAKIMIKDMKGFVYADDLVTASGILEKLLQDKKIGDSLNLIIDLSKSGYLGKQIIYAGVIKKPVVKLHESLDFGLDKLAIGEDIGKLININPIYFDLNKYNIRPDAASELDKIVKVMRENPSIVIELGSHTDCRSSKAYNMTLSSNRAKSSAAYIVSKGIPKSRIYGKGYGESKLVNNCACEMPVKSTCTEEEHQQNRRTEFVIVKM